MNVKQLSVFLENKEGKLKSAVDAISSEGISSDHTEAAIITPDAKPSSAFCSQDFICPFRKNTIAAPSVVPSMGISAPKTAFATLLISSPLKFHSPVIYIPIIHRKKHFVMHNIQFCH